MSIPAIDVEYCGYLGSGLSERDAEVLNAIDEEELVAFTFDGLKRRLDLHSETLSRILARLEGEGAVEKTAEGYTVASKIARSRKLGVPRRESPRLCLIQTYLPSDVPLREIISNLKGRWFGLLRWLGLAESSRGFILKWITEEGDLQIDLRIAENAVSIEAKFLRCNDVNLALKAAYQLMSHLSNLCSRRNAARQIVTPVAYFRGLDPYFAQA